MPSARRRDDGRGYVQEEMIIINASNFTTFRGNASRFTHDYLTSLAEDLLVAHIDLCHWKTLGDKFQET